MAGMFVRFRASFLVLLATVLTVVTARPAAAQTEPCSAYEQLPVVIAPDSKPVLRCVQLFVHPDNESVIDQGTYAYYVKEKKSNPGAGTNPAITKLDNWVPYDEKAVLADFQNLWKTGFLDNLWIEVIDEPFENGAMGMHVIFHMEERSRVKVIDYVSTDPKTRLKVDVSKIEDALKEKSITLRYDTFVDQATIRKVQAVVRDLYAEKGYQAATVDPQLTPIEGGPKLVRLTFNIASGPEVKIREVQFDGNSAFSDKKLAGQMKDNKPKSWLSFITDAGTYQEAKFADDAEKLRDFYQNQGYVQAHIGTPRTETIEDSKDGKTRWIRLVVPLDEGQKYRVGKFEVTGNTIVKEEGIRPAFKMKEGDLYSRKKVVKGIEEIHKVYGMLGFFEFNAYPEFCFRGTNCETGKPLQDGTELPSIVDMKLHLDEGKQFFVNRITFLGNTTTRDNVIRRELRVAEGGVFNSEALKESVKRLNQLGYFKPVEKAEDIQVEPAPGTDNMLNVRLKFEEQNRNQLAFGAGVSQFDGFFGQLSFQTSNFLGRGETIGISLQKGSQARNYQVSFSEPYLFDRPITAGVDLYSRQYIFPSQYTQDERGTTTIVGFPLGRGYQRAYLGYSFAKIRVHDINPVYLDPAVLAASPYLQASLLINEGGDRSVSKVSPSYVYNTVNRPIFPTAGKRYTVGFDFAGVGGDTQYWSTNAEAIIYKQVSRKMSVAFRGQVQYAKPYGDTFYLPIFEKFFQGGEYSIRGFDIRSVGPRDPQTGVVVGGNKAVLGNVEYYFDIFGPVRFLVFYDAGQVKDVGQNLTMWDSLQRVVNPAAPLLSDPLNFSTLVDPTAPKPVIETLGRISAFKTSTGAELRFFMPVLNVPFRLIAAYNPQRAGVLNNNLVLTPRFTFRFAVGTTF